MEFNLVTDNWIRVYSNGTKEVSLSEFFKHAHEYEVLVGDSRQQDLSTLRFLLAIVQRVYAGESAKDLLKLGKFDDRVQDYLNDYKNRFDMFGETPFYQVTKETYNKYADDRFKIKKEGKQTGTVDIKQLNRNISESNNSPSLFSSATESHKNDITMPELVRWLIAYQNFTAVTDKSKAVLGYPVKVSTGWLYKIDPVYLSGSNLFETLILNFTEESIPQKPTWEWYVNDYVAQVNEAPDNVSQLYTLLSRLIYIDWSNDKPMILATGLPMPENISDPMAMQNKDKKGNAYPRTRNLNQLHDYVAFELDKVFELPIFNTLKNIYYKDRIISIINNNYINNGNAPSQLPVASIFEELKFNSNLFYEKRNEMLAVSAMTSAVINTYRTLLYNAQKTSYHSLNKKKLDRMSDEFKDKAFEIVDNWLWNPTNMYRFADEIELLALNEMSDEVEEKITSDDLKRMEIEDEPMPILKATEVYGYTIRKIINQYKDVK